MLLDDENYGYRFVSDGLGLSHYTVYINGNKSYKDYFSIYSLKHIRVLAIHLDLISSVVLCEYKEKILHIYHKELLYNIYFKVIIQQI